VAPKGIISQVKRQEEGATIQIALPLFVLGRITSSFPSSPGGEGRGEGEKLGKSSRFKVGDSKRDRVS